MFIIRLLSSSFPLHLSLSLRFVGFWPLGEQKPKGRKKAEKRKEKRKKKDGFDQRGYHALSFYICV